MLCWLRRDNVLIELEGSSRLLHATIRGLPDHKDVAIAFPDEGLPVIPLTSWSCLATV